MKRFLALGIGAAALAGAAPGAAHIDITYPPMRHIYTDNGQKVPVCESGAMSGVVTEHVAGDQLAVTWDETIPHPGHFRVALDTDGNGVDNFVDPVDYDDKAVQGNIVAFVEDPGGSEFGHTFTLPDIECSACVLQVIQVMTDKPPWGPDGGGDIYYWCADIAITSASGAGGRGPSTTASGSGGGTSGAGGGSGDGGSGVGADGSGPAQGFPEDEDSGCAMAKGGSRSWGWLALVGLGLLVRTARSRSERRRGLPTRA